MSFWDDLFTTTGRVLKAPAGAGAGFVGGLQKFIDPEADPENKLGYGNPFSGFLQGAQKGHGAAQTLDYLAGDYNTNDSPINKALGFVLDVGTDPLTYAGGAGKLAASTGKLGKLGELAGKAGSVEKLGKDAGVAARLAQAGRRFGQGTALAAGNPIGGLTYATAGNWVEPAIAKSAAIQKLLGRGAPKVVDEAAAALKPRVAGPFTGKTTSEIAAKTPGVADEAVASATPVNPHQLPGKVTGKRYTRTFKQAPEPPPGEDIRDIYGKAVGEAPLEKAARYMEDNPLLNLPPSLEDIMARAEISHLRGAAKKAAANKMLRSFQAGG